jgi:hypothetical protein
MEPPSYWAHWARFLQRFGLQQATAVFLESAGPLTWFTAQLVYLGQPFLDGSRPGGQWQALANMLENQTDSRSFAAFLREEETR